MKNNFKLAFFRLSFCLVAVVTQILVAKLVNVDIGYVEILMVTVIVMFISEPLFD